MDTVSTRLCKKCAECCKHYPYIKLSKIDIEWIAAFTQLSINVFADSTAMLTSEYFLKFTDNGDCYFLDEEKGIYSCAIYKIRPGICKDYPSTIKQKEFCSKNLIDIG